MCISKQRKKIYNFFQASKSCQNFFFAPENKERYSGYYTSMYLIADTHEGLVSHRKKGFSTDNFIAYIEFWGVMQAIFIQQDAIAELYWSTTGCKLETSLLKKRQAIRTLRNTCAGHPAKKDQPKKTPLTRTFMGRDFGDYNNFHYEQWQSPDKISHPQVQLGNLIEEYEFEAPFKYADTLGAAVEYFGVKGIGTDLIQSLQYQVDNLDMSVSLNENYTAKPILLKAQEDIHVEEQGETYQGKTLLELRKIGKEKGLKGIFKFNKHDLIQVLIDNY